MQGKHQTEVKPPARAIDPLSLAYEPLDISPRRRQFSRRVVNGLLGFFHLIARRWLTILNLINFAYVFLALITPYATAWGWSGFSNWSYGFCHIVCVQNPAHSFYLEGHQMALCERCLAIYATLGLLGLVFHLLRYRLRPLKTWHYGLLSIPIALDSFTQLFGWRESTWELRFLTGGIFAFATVWYFYPTLERLMQSLCRKLARELNRTRQEAYL